MLAWHITPTQFEQGDGEARRSASFAAPQGKGGIYLAGAWAGYGFHEDGLKAGIAVAEALGAKVPWQPRPASPKASSRCHSAMLTCWTG